MTILCIKFNLSRMILTVLVEFAITLTGEMMRLAPMFISSVTACEGQDDAESVLTSMGKRASVLVGCEDRSLLRTLAGIWFLIAVVLWYILLRYIYHMYWVIQAQLEAAAADETADERRIELKTVRVEENDYESEEKQPKNAQQKEVQ